KIRGFGASGDSVAYLDAQTLRQRGIIGDIVNYIAVQTTAPGTVINFIGDFPALRAVETKALVNEIKSSPDFSSASLTYWLIDLIILFIAGMFVNNMLGRSVAERRLEFGTLRAIGVPSRSILFSIAAEALFIILASYCVGFVVSLVLGTAVNGLLSPAYGLPPMFGVDPTSYSVILVVSIVMGLIAGFFPARGATKVDPLEVLREA
ncbi:MAG: ABC transporter permease, partial [Bacteroidetes bacterium]|nr:ABC transporter permease [Bacteroidota bacterium]